MSNTFSKKYAGLRPQNIKAFPIASATVIEVGDWVKLSSGLIVRANVAADGATCLGRAVEAQGTGNVLLNGKIAVELLDGVSSDKIALASAEAITAGDKLDIAGNQTLAVGATAPIAMAIEGDGSVLSEVEVLFIPTQAL